MARKLDTDEINALERFAAAHGRTWKSKLGRRWYNACVWRGDGSEPHDGAILHALRNDPNWGVKGLDKHRLQPKPKGIPMRNMRDFDRL